MSSFRNRNLWHIDKNNASTSCCKKQRILFLMFSLLTVFNTLSSFVFWANYLLPINSIGIDLNKAQEFFYERKNEDFPNYLDSRISLVMNEVNMLKQQFSGFGYNGSIKLKEMDEFTVRSGLSQKKSKGAEFESLIQAHRKDNQEEKEKKSLSLSFTHTNTLSNSPKTENKDRRLISSVLLQNTNSACNQIPILSPVNYLNEFHFDDRADGILKLLHGLSQTISFDNQDNPQYKAACWILYDDGLMLNGTDHFMIQRYVLAVLFYSCKKNDGMLLIKETCEYDIVKCNQMGYITDIDMRLEEGSLMRIPPEVSYLKHLERLFLNDNNLKGSIPPEIGRLKYVKELHLEGNAITGTLPTEIGQMSSLEVLAIDSKLLMGTLPSEVGRLTHLKRLELGHNSFHGTIPETVYDCVKLQILHLNNNLLTGTISTQISKLNMLQRVHLNDNAFQGKIPSDLGNLRSLKELWLGSNRMTGNFPSELGEAGSVELIALNENLLSGTLPDLFGKFTDLKIINLRNNLFSGAIPTSIFSGKIEHAVILDGNNFEGSVPEHICSSSTQINVDDNIWFVDEPEVSCECCEVSCNIWDVKNSLILGAKRSCPQSNVFNIEFKSGYWIKDLIINSSIHDFFGFGMSHTESFCLSPTGCYSIFNETEDHHLQDIKFSSMTNSLQFQKQCDVVEICGKNFGQDHPRRNGLNHLSQLIGLDLSRNDTLQYKALCWILNEDVLFNFFRVCDGTLLQRYVLALFYLSQRHFIHDFEELSKDTTCKWPGVVCDVKEKYVEELSLHGSNLAGTIVTEIGLLTRLKTINFTENDITGTLNPSLFSNLYHLERIDISSNKITGEVPRELLEHPRIEHFNISNNNFQGILSGNITYPKKLKHFDISNNLMQGSIPKRLTSCVNLELIDLSQNNFGGVIPSNIGNIERLRVLNLAKNKLTGSIPNEIFDASNVQILFLHSNTLTGTLPTEIGLLKAARQISLSHNSLKGTIPTELASMGSLTLLRLHQNRLFGTAPGIGHLRKEGTDSSYITDCGDPSFLLSRPLICDSCTICCNSLNQCQKNIEPVIPVEVTGYLIFATLVPLVLIGFIHIIYAAQKKGYLRMLDERNALSIYNEDSVYCLIFSNNYFAWIIYILTGAIQALMLGLFLKASDFHDTDTDWQYTMRCSASSLACDDESSRNWNGWFLFFTVTILFLGADFVDSILQMRKAVVQSNKRFLLSGLGLFFLTMLALYTSFLYNVALAASNTELIMNAVILLFINDLDEKLLNILESVAPTWIANRYIEIELNLSNNDDNQDEIERPPRFVSSRFAGIKSLTSWKEQGTSRRTSGLTMLGIIGSSVNISKHTSE